MEIEIFFKRGSDKHNKPLYEFLKHNLDKLNHSGIIIRPKVYGSNDIKELKKQGLNQLPALVHQANKVFGVKSIENYVLHVYKTKKQKPSQNNQPQTKLENDDVQDWMLAEMNRDINNDNGGGNNKGQDLHSKMAAFEARRSHARRPMQENPKQQNQPKQQNDVLQHKDPDYENNIDIDNSDFDTSNEADRLLMQMFENQN